MSNTLTTEEASEYLKIAAYTLARWRATGKGPVYLKLGESKISPVRYRKEDLDRWLEQHRRDPEADNGVR